MRLHEIQQHIKAYGQMHHMFFTSIFVKKHVLIPKNRFYMIKLKIKNIKCLEK